MQCAVFHRHHYQQFQMQYAPQCVPAFSRSPNTRQSPAYLKWSKSKTLCECTTHHEAACSAHKHCLQPADSQYETAPHMIHKWQNVWMPRAPFCDMTNNARNLYMRLDAYNDHQQCTYNVYRLLLVYKLFLFGCVIFSYKTKIVPKKKSNNRLDSVAHMRMLTAAKM